MDLAVSPDGEHLAIAGTGGDWSLPRNETVVYDLADQPVLRYSRSGFLAWSPNGRRLAIVLDPEGREGRGPQVGFCVPRDPSFSDSLQAHAGMVICATYCRSASLFATGGLDRTVRLWDADRLGSQRVLRQPGMVYSLAFSPQGDEIVAGLSDGTIAVWDLQALRMVRSWKAHPAPVRRLAFSLDGRTLFSCASFDPAVRCWDPANGNEKNAFPVALDWLTSLVLSPDGRNLAVGGGSFHGSGEVYLLDAANGALRRRFTVATNSVTAIDFVHDGKVLVAGSTASIGWGVRAGQGQVHRWNLDTGEELPSLVE